MALVPLHAQADIAFDDLSIAAVHGENTPLSLASIVGNYLTTAR
ncbi:hypothetical protein [Phyllobacterium sp. K27]